jgi:nitrogen regulatory protein P-II 1
MKLVVAVLKPFKLDEVKEALKTLGVQGMTLTEAQGFGRQRGTPRSTGVPSTRSTSSRRSGSRCSSTTPRPTEVVDAIVRTAATGKIGDGKVWVLPVEDGGPGPYRRARGGRPLREGRSVGVGMAGPHRIPDRSGQPAREASAGLVGGGLGGRLDLVGVTELSRCVGDREVVEPGGTTRARRWGSRGRRSPRRTGPSGT